MFNSKNVPTFISFFSQFSSFFTHFFKKNNKWHFFSLTHSFFFEKWSEWQTLFISFGQFHWNVTHNTSSTDGFWFDFGSADSDANGEIVCQTFRQRITERGGLGVGIGIRGERLGEKSKDSDEEGREKKMPVKKSNFFPLFIWHDGIKSDWRGFFFDCYCVGVSLAKDLFSRILLCNFIAFWDQKLPFFCLVVMCHYGCWS